jgi:O-antigen/teichoic acid export membrane protein
MTTLRNKTIRGIGWMATSQVITQAARIGFMIALARLLSPEEFGLWGMVMVFTGFVSLMSDIGLGAALIQRPEIEQKHLSTAFWVNSGLGIILCLIMMALSVPLSQLYGVPRLAPLLAITSIEFIVKGVTVVHRVLFVREMDFRSLAVTETWSIFLAGIAACALAAGGFGAWSLVAQSLVASTGAGIWIVWLRPWRPGFHFDLPSLKQLLHFGLHLQGFNLINYWLRNLDKLLIGRLMGEAALGFYTRAYSTMLLPQSQISGMLERVMWPALARCASEPARLREAYLGTLRMICFVSFPCMTGLSVTSHEFIHSLFGPVWDPSVATLRWLCLAGFVQAPVSTTGWLYLATGRTRRMLIWSVMASAVTIPAMIMGALAGTIESMAIWYTGSAVVLAPLAFYVACPTAALTLLDIIRAIYGSAIASVVMGAAVYAVAHVIPMNESPVRLFILVVAGGVFYFTTTLKTQASIEARTLLRTMKSVGAKTPAAPA